MTNIWTDEQVEALNKMQKDKRMHPYTCPGERSNNQKCPDRVLIATREGWVCACGEYTQAWAHQINLKGRNKC